jgi:hypothetical protein
MKAGDIVKKKRKVEKNSDKCRLKTFSILLPLSLKRSDFMDELKDGPLYFVCMQGRDASLLGGTAQAALSQFFIYIFARFESK